MTPAFADLTLGPLDEQESFKRSGQLWEKVFFLSGPVPERWAELFLEVWAGAREVPKRHARIENGELLTICLAEEAASGHVHMQFLRRALELTNEAYRAELGRADAPTAS